MPEIRLANGNNMRNINLGSVEIQEVRLGTVLVWRNNLGIVYASLTWDGNTFTATGWDGVTLEDDTEINANTWTLANALPAGRHDGVAGSGADESVPLNIVVSTIADPDNVGAVPADQHYLVGYRLQRPDGSYAAGDPASTLNRAGASDTAPIADFGEILPGTTSTWDAVNEVFTAGSTTLTSSTIPANIRAIDDTGTGETPSTVIVNSATAEFADAGTWNLTLIDSTGGESEARPIVVSIQYDRPTYTVGGQGRNAGDTADVGGAITLTNSDAVNSGAATTPTTTSITNATIGGPNTVTLSPAYTGGPADSYAWTCVSGCTEADATTETFNVTIPQHASGTATPAVVQLTTTGRRWMGDSGAGLTSTRRVAFRSGASCSPGYTIPSGSGGSITFFSDPTNTTTCDPLAMAPSPAPTPTCTVVSGTSTCAAAGFSASAGSFSIGTVMCGTTVRVSASGTTTGTINVTAPGSREFSGSNPGRTGTNATWSPSSNPLGATLVSTSLVVNGLGTCPTCAACVAPAGTPGTCVISGRVTPSPGGTCLQSSSGGNSWQNVRTVACTTGGTITNSLPAGTASFPNALTTSGSFGSGTPGSGGMHFDASTFQINNLGQQCGTHARVLSSSCDCTIGGVLTTGITLAGAFFAGRTRSTGSTWTGGGSCGGGTYSSGDSCDITIRVAHRTGGTDYGEVTYTQTISVP